MPKVVVYVRADDERNIESTTGKRIDDWVRETVAIQIELWKQAQAARRAEE